jgi:hypothetical protein
MAIGFAFIFVFLLGSVIGYTIGRNSKATTTTNYITSTNKNDANFNV